MFWTIYKKLHPWNEKLGFVVPASTYYPKTRGEQRLRGTQSYTVVMTEIGYYLDTSTRRYLKVVRDAATFNLIIRSTRPTCSNRIKPFSSEHEHGLLLQVPGKTIRPRLSNMQCHFSVALGVNIRTLLELDVECAKSSFFLFATVSILRKPMYKSVASGCTTLYYTRTSSLPRRKGLCYDCSNAYSNNTIVIDVRAE